MRCECVVCAKPFKVVGVRSLSSEEGSSLDCPECGASLIISGGELREAGEYLSSLPDMPSSSMSLGIIDGGSGRES